MRIDWNTRFRQADGAYLDAVNEYPRSKSPRQIAGLLGWRERCWRLLLRQDLPIVAVKRQATP